MIELIVQGIDPRQRYRLPLAPGEWTIGRGVECEVPVPWDPHVSRRHARVLVQDGHANVVRLTTARNPLFANGRESASCRIATGGHFVIGSTVFEITAPVAEGGSPLNEPVEEVTFNRRDLERVRFRDADKRIDVLTRLPEVINGSRTDSELYRQLAAMLLAGIPHAGAVVIVAVNEANEVKILHSERRREADGAVRPSTTLVHDALVKRERSVLHVWGASAAPQQDYTVTAEFDWAYCTPIPSPAAPFCWGVYVAGKIHPQYVVGEKLAADDSQLHADVKFTELLADIVCSVRRVNTLERQRSSWRQFFAPAVLDALGDDFDAELLVPRECDVTVMFCDLRGFSQHAEDNADDLLGLLDRVSRALGVMTREIRRFGGVTADFQGDSTLGFWGWPLASKDAPLDACRAALAIRAAFAATEREPDHPLHDFQMGIGLAHGRAVAGKIGTAEQVKVTVFGPVVNLASRLESMTRHLRVPILLDESTAEIVRSRMPRKDGRVRRLARVLPYGIDAPLTVSELLPPPSQDPRLTDEQIEQYERGVELFIAGQWEEAYACLHAMPAGDRAQDFLTIRIAEHARAAPADWDGIIRLPGK